MMTPNGRFDPPAPKLEWVTDGDEDYAKLLEDFTYVDRAGFAWRVPAGYETDGASIPRLFWRVVGNPMQGHYRRAAIIHDFYCDERRTRPFWRVHYVFWEAMRTCGVGRFRAWVMWFAVRTFGPRW